MERLLVAGMLLLGSLSGCIVMQPGHLYPVKGPLAAQTPLPIASLTLSGVLNTGSLRVTLPSGETCAGDWSVVPQGDPSATAMSEDWDAVYGAGFFVAHVLGSPAFARAQLSGSRGTTMSVQFYTPEPGNIAQVAGVAADNQGNVFKLTL
jgi:hypothetical protein